MWLDDFGRDVQYALRMLSRSRSFTAIIIVTLALGIGATTAIFSVVNALMLRSLPVRQPEQLVEMLFKYPRDPRLNLYRWKDYEHFRDFGASSPVGRHFSLEGQAAPLEIVGVVGDAKYNDLHDMPPRTVYLNAFQGSGGTNFTFVLRTNVRPMSVVGNVRRAVRDVLPNVPLATVTTLAEQVDASILPERLVAMLSGLFGALAALLVAIGIYGLLAYTVTRRINEIGIRIAIGATSRDVTWMVLTSALGLVIAGLIIGVPIALWTKAYAASVLAVVAATQAEAPIVLPVGTIVPIVVGAIAILVVAFVASCVPARRATKVDPLVALRCE